MSHCNRDKFNYFLICGPLARCPKRGSSLPLGTPMEIDFTNAYLHYPLPQCSKIVTPMSVTSFSAYLRPKSPRTINYSGLLFGKLTQNNAPFLDTIGPIDVAGCSQRKEYLQCPHDHCASPYT